MSHPSSRARYHGFRHAARRQTADERRDPARRRRRCLDVRTAEAPPPALATYPRAWAVAPADAPPAAASAARSACPGRGGSRCCSTPTRRWARTGCWRSPPAWCSTRCSRSSRRSPRSCRSTACSPSTSTIQDHLSLLSNVLPAGGIESCRSRSRASLSSRAELSVGFAVGLVIALWSANAGVKAMIDALNVIEAQNESRSFVRLNAAVARAHARRDRASCWSRSAPWWRSRW